MSTTVYFQPSICALTMFDHMRQVIHSAALHRGAHPYQRYSFDGMMAETPFKAPTAVMGDWLELWVCRARNFDFGTKGQSDKHSFL
jgi:hypothetical protein